MFANQRRGTAGLEGLIGVGLVLLGWIAGTGVLVKVYRDGGTDGTNERCEVVCRGAAKAGANG